MTGLQPVALPSGSSVRKSPATKDGRRSSFLSKSSDLGWHHQKRPFFRQHFLKRLPLPHGQRSLRPSFSSSSLSPLTIRTPRLTCVSDGNPFRRLLIVSKKTAVRRSCVWPWDTSIRVAVRKENRSVLARNRTWSSTFAESRAIRHTPRTFGFHKAAHRGIEPRLAESKSAVRSGTLAGQNCRESSAKSRKLENDQCRLRFWLKTLDPRLSTLFHFSNSTFQ